MWTRINQNFAIPPDVREIINRLNQAGFDAFIVGGAVRDFLRGESIKDYDLATNASPDQVQELFENCIDVGKAFGVIKVIHAESRREIEIVTFRSEEDYQNHRHPKTVVFSNIESDAARRDFTVNALYFDIKTNEIWDGYGGCEDIKNKCLRAIGEPSKRFQEDALRLIRAVRFSVRFGFKIEENTREAILKHSPLIRKVSIERVRDELERMLKHSSCRQAIKELDDLGLLENTIPEVSVAKLTAIKSWDQTLRALRVLGRYTPDFPEPPSFYWTMLMLPTFRLLPLDQRADEANAFCQRLKLSNDQTDQVLYLVRETAKFREVFSMRDARLLRWMREPHFDLLLRFHELDALAFDGNLAGLEFVRSIFPEAKRRFEMKPLITGEDLLKLGMTPGRHFSEILRQVEDLQLEGTLSSSDQALDYVLQHYVR